MIRDSTGAGRQPATIFERHFSPRTLAELWGYSEDTILRWAEHEEGVLRCGSEGGRGRKRKRTIRIPESVARRMYEKHTQN